LVVTTAAVVHGAGPAVAVRAPGSDDAPVAAEVVEVLGSGPGELALLEAVAPGFVMPLRPADDRPSTRHDRLPRFRRLGAARLRHDRKIGGAAAREGESSEVETTSEQAGGARRTANSSEERGLPLLAYPKERARTGRLDPVVTVPSWERASSAPAPEGPR
jgi:hypothetical protein